MDSSSLLGRGAGRGAGRERRAGRERAAERGRGRAGGRGRGRAMPNAAARSRARTQHASRARLTHHPARPRLTQHPAPSTPHPAPSTPHPAPSTPHPAPSTHYTRPPCVRRAREAATVLTRPVGVAAHGRDLLTGFKGLREAALAGWGCRIDVTGCRSILWRHEGRLARSASSKTSPPCRPAGGCAAAGSMRL